MGVSNDVRSLTALLRMDTRQFQISIGGLVDSMELQKFAIDELIPAMRRVAESGQRLTRT